MSEFKEFLEALKEPYHYDEKVKKYQKLAPMTNTKYQTFCGI